jgi:hypothetical protein
VLLLVLVVPVGFLLIKNRPQDVGLEPQGDGHGEGGSSGEIVSRVGQEYGARDSTLREALRTPFFWKLTVGYFV